MVIDFSELASVRKKHSHQKIVFAGGCFDLTHAGHVVFLEEAKKIGDILVAQVGSDDEVRIKKGGAQPIFNEHMRLKLIDSLRPVDYAFIEENFIPDTEHPLKSKDEILEKLRPDVYVVNTDTSDADYLKKITKKHGVQLVVLPRHCPPEFENVSTSNIIKKIREHKN